MSRAQAAEFFGEMFDDAQADLSAAIAAKDKADALACRRHLESIRRRATRAGVDTEYDGGWMVPSAQAVREQVAP